MPTIAVIANTSWNLHNFRRSLIRRLMSEGFEVVAIAPTDEFSEKVRSLGCRFAPLESLERKGTNPFGDVRLAREFARIFRREKISVALTFTIKPNIYGSVAGWIAGVPTVATVTGLGYTFLEPGILQTITRRLYKFAFSKSARVVFQNADDREVFLQGRLAPAAKTMLIRGSGIDTTHFAPQPQSLENERLTFLFIARLLFHKGIREYVEAARIVHEKRPNTLFQIAGDLDPGNPSAITEADLQSWLARPEIEYLGHLSDTRPAMAKADVVVLPSYREGLPRVILEALSMSKPIVTTDTAGCRDTLIENENGYLAPVGDAAGLADAMLRMTNLTAVERHAMGEKSRQLALQEFDEKIVQAKYLEIIRSLTH
ncbi:MAG: glycosyltransferase family 4 protein [Saprospiraceae bacterium]